VTVTVVRSVSPPRRLLLGLGLRSETFILSAKDSIIPIFIVFAICKAKFSKKKTHSTSKPVSANTCGIFCTLHWPIFNLSSQIKC
jgi:hypothetical protein